VQGFAAVADRRAGLKGLHARYGPDFTVDVPIFGRVVVISEPDHVRQIFRSPPAELDTVAGSLGRVMGPNSLFALTGERHRIQRKMLTPPFHGHSLRSFEAVLVQESVREFATWEQGREFATMPSMMRITLNAILRAMFGAEGSQFERLQRLLPSAVRLGSMLSIVPVPQWDWGRWSPWGRFFAARREYDAIVDELIADARADPRLDERDDVLAVMLRSRYADGAEMTRDEIADQLVTMLTAGYETTATTLAWAVERLRRHPALLVRLVAELDDGGDDLLVATIAEVQRCRPVVDTTFREVAARSYRLGPWTLPHGQTVMVAIGLVHDDEALFGAHDRFDPDRFLVAKPDASAWIPFGGGTRRCIGAAFATMELRVVLREMLREFTLVPTTGRSERWRSRGVAMAPGSGGLAVVTRRRPPSR
jgi:hypothetical protein